MSIGSFYFFFVLYQFAYMTLVVSWIVFSVRLKSKLNHAENECKRLRAENDYLERSCDQYAKDLSNALQAHTDLWLKLTALKAKDLTNN